MVKYFPKARLLINHRLLKILNTLFNKYPLNSQNDYSPVFIIGSGRSGTTLLRTILNNHPDIIIPPETFGFRNGLIKFKCLQHLPWNILAERVINTYEGGKEFFLWEINLNEVYEKAKILDNNNRSLADLIHLIFHGYLNAKDPSAKIWGDKTPLNTFYLDWVYKTFPKAKFINMIRDGRDVVSSLIKAKLTNVRNGCLRWNLAINNSQYFQSKIDSNQFLNIYYENLVTDPNRTVNSICNFLNIPFEEKLLKNSKNISSMHEVKYYEHFKNLLNPINNNSIGNWEKYLSAIEQKLVNKLLAKNLKELGYN